MKTKSSMFKKLTTLALAFAMVLSVLAPVNAEAASKKYVTALSVSKTTVTMKAGQTVKPTATVKVSGTASKKVTAKSSNTAVAKVSVKYANGKNTLMITGVKKGTAKVTVTTADKNKAGKKLSKIISVKVNYADVSKLSVTPTSKTLEVGTSVTLKSQISPANAVQSLTYTSSNKNVATVSSAGKVIAKAPGTATITVRTKGKNVKGNYLKRTVTIKVSDISVTGVELDAHELTLDVNAGSTLTATVAPAKATNKAVTWTSSDSSVASVDANGYVKAIKAGTATIKVTTVDGSFSDTCSVTVKDKSIGIADGMTLTVTNDLDEYSDAAKKDFVCLTGNDANIKIQVIANGAPYSNQKVKLTLKPQYGNAENLYMIEGKEWSQFATTDADGYASFVVSLTNNYSQATATSSLYQSYSLSAQLSSDTSVKADGTLTFGCVSLVSPHVVNELTNLEPGKNAQASDCDGTASVASKNQSYYQEYVTSQQVSSATIDHSVTIATYPVMWLPATASEIKTGTYVDTKFAKKSGEYSVYNDETNETTTTVIDTIPAGLEWARIYFDEMELSEYTKLVITFYEIDNEGNITGNIIDQQIKTAKNLSEADKTIQVPVQDDIAICAVVALYSEGQVDDDSNAGYTITKIEGEWKSTAQTEYRVIDIVDSHVTWSIDDKFVRSASNNELTLAQAAQYLPNGTQNEYYNKDYTYTYDVPAFPSVGNAVIKVKNQNGADVAYFTYPIVNVNNTNDIAPYDYHRYGKAVLIGTEDEYSKVVGTNLKADGAFVTVDSSVTGYTPLKANIDLGSLGVSINNPDAYSFIQWAPFYEEEQQIMAEDFYALAGQKVEITAQLVDRASGNNVTQSGANLTFTTAEGQDLKDFVDATTFTTSTTNGKITFTVSATNDFDYLKNLSATTSGYDVKLIIGGKTVDLATIHWIDAGLYFKDAVDLDDADGNAFLTFQNLTITNAMSGNLDRQVGNNWIFGLKTVGMADTDTANSGLAIGDISGINIDFTKSGVGGALDKTVPGQVTILSEQIGQTDITGLINSNSVPTPASVIFTVVDAVTGDVIGTYTNVGTGSPLISASIKLEVTWTKKGLVPTVELPLGEQLDITTPSTVYIKVVDAYGNKLAGEDVVYTVSALGNIAAVTNGAGQTDANGLLAIDLAAPGQAGTVKIAATVAGESCTGTIQYNANNADAFGLVSATLDKEAGTVTVNFTNAVDAKSIDARAFTITLGEKTYAISSAAASETDSNAVILRLTDASELTNVDATTITLTVAPYEANGLAYQIKSMFNQVITGANVVNLQ